MHSTEHGQNPQPLLPEQGGTTIYPTIAECIGYGVIGEPYAEVCDIPEQSNSYTAEVEVQIPAPREQLQQEGTPEVLATESDPELTITSPSDEEKGITVDEEWRLINLIHQTDDEKTAQAAFGELFKHLAPLIRVQSAFSGMIRDDIDDVISMTAQRSWTTLRKNPPTQKGDSSSLAWFRTVARNIARDEARKTSSRPKIIGSPVEEMDPAIQSVESPEQIAGDRIATEQMLKEIIERYVDRINNSVNGGRKNPRDSLRLVWLVHALGYSMSEVAKMEGMPLGSVKSQTAKTLGYLREAVEQIDQREKTNHTDRI